MLNKIRKKEILRVLPLALVKIVIGMGLMIYYGLFGYLIGPTNLLSLDIKDSLNEYVYYELDYNYGWYVESYYSSASGSQTDYREYLVFIEENVLGISVKNSKQLKEYDNQTDQTFDYLNGVSSKEPNKIKVKGYTREMLDEDKEYFYDYVAYLYDTSIEEAKQMDNVVPMVIDVSKVNAKHGEATVITFSVFGLLFILYAGYDFFKALSMKKYSSLVKYIVKHPDEDKDIEKFMNGKNYSGIIMNEKYFAYVKSDSIFFTTSNNIVWAYRHEASHRTETVVDMTYRLKIGTINGSMISVPVGSVEYSVELMEYLKKHNNNIVFGYSVYLASLFENDPAKFLELAKDTM